MARRRLLVDKAPFLLRYNTALPVTKNAAKGSHEGILVQNSQADVDSALQGDARSVLRIISQLFGTEASGQTKYELREDGAMLWVVRGGNQIAVFPIGNMQGGANKRALAFRSAFDSAFGSTASAALDFHDVPDFRLPSAGQIIPIKDSLGGRKDVNFPSIFTLDSAEQRLNVPNAVTTIDTTGQAVFPANSIPLFVSWAVDTQPNGTASMSVGTPANAALFAAAGQSDRKSVV